MKEIVSIKNLNYSYSTEEKQLHDIDLSIHEGEVVVITGASGSGKSTLTKVINGLIPYFYGGELSGNVLLCGKDLTELANWKRGFLVGNVFQDPRSQFFCNEVAGEIAFGCENQGLSHKEIKTRVDKVSEEFGLYPYLFDAVNTLSFGTRQKIAIASAKAIEPQIFVMDEPSANLDMMATYNLAKTIKQLKDSGKTLFIAEHRLYYLSGIVDRILYIKDGKITETFTEDELISFDKEKMKYLGLREMDLLRIKDKISTKNQDQEEVLALDNISKSFDNKKVLKDISFSIKSGEVVAIVGPNSSGKSTLGKLISGIVKEDSGNIVYLNKKTAAKKRLSKIWYISQELDTQLFAESVFLELLIGKKADEYLENRADNILKDLGLYELKDRHPASLSGGQKQRLTIGVALMHDAKIIILDEPTSGLDATNMRNVSQIITGISKQGTSIIMITHDIECAMETCERVIQIVDGTVVYDEPLTSAKTLIDMCSSTLYENGGFNG